MLYTTSSSWKPRRVTEGVPTRIPEVTNGLLGSFGTHLLTVILKTTNAASAALPVKPLLTKSTRKR